MVMVKTSCTVITISCESRHFCTVSNLRGKYFSLHHKCDVSHGYYDIHLIILVKFPCITNLIFNHKNVEFCQMLYLNVLRWPCVFFPLFG